MEILEKLMQHNILEIAGVISNCVRWLFWKLIIGLSMLVNSIEKSITKIYSINGFFNSTEVNTLINKYKPLVWLILAVSIGILGFKIMFNRKQNRGELPSNILFSILVLVLLPTLMIKLDDMTSIAVKDVASEYTSSANELIKNNIYDLYYLDSNRFNLNTKNNIDSKDIINIDANETIDSDKIINKYVLGKKIEFDKNGRKSLKELEKGWFKIDEEYYRYGIDFLSIIITLGAMGITLICIGLKVARLIFELAFNKLLATFFAFADIGDGKRIKEIIKHIFSIFIVIFATAIMTKLYVVFSSWLGTSLGNAGLSTNGVAKMIVLVGGSIAVIDGPNIIERIIGIDAGLKSGWSAVMAGYGLSKGAIKGVSSLAVGAKNLGKGAILGAGMGAGVLNGMFGKDKNSNISNDTESEDKKNKDNNINSNNIEQDMKNSNNSRNNKNNNIDDENKSQEPNSNSSNIEDEMNKANNKNTDNNIENDINSKNIKDINKNRDKNKNNNSIEEDMNNIKNPNSNNREHLNGMNPKGSINNEISENKGIKNNRDNLGSINSKDRVNNDTGKNQDINNSNKINSKNEFENIRGEEVNNKDNPKLDSSDNKKNKENLVGRMENRTIREYAKDKFKSSKFMDDLNRAYTLGKNSGDKWNVKNKKNNKNKN